MDNSVKSLTTTVQEFDLPPSMASCHAWLKHQAGTWVFIEGTDHCGARIRFVLGHQALSYAFTFSVCFVSSLSVGLLN